MATATAVRPAQTSGCAAYDGVFYSSTSIAMGLTVPIGFSRTYYLPLMTGAPRATMSGGLGVAGAVLAASMPVRIAISGTAAWRALAGLLRGAM